MFKALRRAFVYGLLLPAAVIGAEKSDWVEGSSADNRGANREYYNRAAVLRWQNYLGDWRDSNDQPQGESAYATVEVVDEDKTKLVRFDVTSLVDQWTSEKHPNQGFFLRVIAGGGRIVFASREHPDGDLHPSLELVGHLGSVRLAPVADTYLVKSTYRCQGDKSDFRVSVEPEHALVRFELDQVTDIGTLMSANLVLHSTAQYGSASVGVFRCRQGHKVVTSSPPIGISSGYPLDQGIARDPAVIFATGFESPDWEQEWTVAEPRARIATVGPDERSYGFEELNGRAMRSRIARDEFTALNTTYEFKKEIGAEPEEIYFRYYLRLADDWNQTVQGGKLPGISGTYGRGGWGGRKSDGVNGWSARGLFRMTIPKGNPLGGTTPVGFYCYHADMEGRYGTNWVWDKNYLGFLEKNRWYAIEQHCRLNTPGKPDGVLRAWIDGELAFEKSDIRFRKTADLKIEQVWMNVYHGGTIPSPHDQHVFIDQVVIAKRYIGPLSVK